ncbi:MAG: AmmeMemoRadiSam system radical SAM enzyme [Hyphomicrobiales bacterium]|nr:MAG: AmmeMemoRadiSam system radical SAM enzyme [Hyphomicrobiales bacterium]
MNAATLHPTSTPARSARYWHQLEDDRIQCDLCPRFCKLRDGQRGLCFVRAREGNEIVLTTYGRSSGFCIDPIEKKPLNHFLPGSPVLSFGTAGCNLTCKFCQNWDISKATEFDRLQDEASPQAIAQAAKELGAKSVAFTYNDPVIFLEYAVDVAAACHDAGLKTVAVTAGYITPEARKELFGVMDAANIDLKGFSEGFYKTLCSAELRPVLETLEYVKHETPCWLEITTLLIPGQNDSPAEIEALSSWVRERLAPDTPLHFSAFHPDWRMRETPPTPAATLQTARKIALENGLRYVYTGNVRDEAGQSTYCHNCNQRLIGRDRYDITSWAMTEDGRCLSCGETCDGVFEAEPGLRGSHRLPVRLANASYIPNPR